MAYTFSGTSIAPGGSPKPVGILTDTVPRDPESDGYWVPDGSGKLFLQRTQYSWGYGHFEIVVGSVGAVAFTGRTFIEISTSGDTSNKSAILARVSIGIGEDMGSACFYLESSQADKSLFFRFYHSNSAPVNIQGRVTMFGS